MALTTAERNRRKRERRKKEKDPDKEEHVEGVDAVALLVPAVGDAFPDGIEIEYVEPEIPEAAADAANNEALESLRRFKARVAATVVSSDEAEEGAATRRKSTNNNGGVEDDDDDEEEERLLLSKRKLRDLIRPTVADLKRNVQRPDLVEAHDVTATDPEFLIRLKAVPGSVPVPRHWGRKRKYLQGKRGFEKAPFQLPAFLVNTGITELRDTVMDAEKEMSAKQKNRSRVQVKLGAIDVDYRTLHDAFFKHQTKPAGLTRLGDLYYEGKELDATRKRIQVGRPLSAALRAALNMTLPTSPPPWLTNMQRYGPPPSYPSLKIPGLNAPLPDPACQYGYHPQGWGKPPIDPYGRPLYGGNPFDPPGISNREETRSGKYGTEMVTSDGKTVSKADWGALPMGEAGAEEEDDESSSSEEEMDESEEEHEEGEEAVPGGAESTLPPPLFSSTTAPVDLRKTGTETPMSAAAALPKQLYTVLEQKQAAAASSATVFASEIAYAMPATTTAAVDETGGAESVLSKAMPLPANERNNNNNKNKRGDNKNKDDEDDEDLGKNFKF